MDSDLESSDCHPRTRQEVLVGARMLEVFEVPQYLVVMCELKRGIKPR